ncbi:SMI1/KNR4 family protein [Metasolibacillus meyeri]|uniref:SMI1/KNR4 family protein n=1 Tax=Metasolibacillus meyeri TaxID=1071052 RepID=UPI000D31C116|nr:SMI1/KNR4 family protein [Metasolibacillus meyeri]
MSIELTLTSLMKRLEQKNRLTVQMENGEILNVTFDWNSPISNQELETFSLKNPHHVLPKALCSFLKHSHGAKLFNNEGLGLDYFEIYTIHEMQNYIDEYKTNIYYQGAYDKSWVMIGAYRGYGDYMFIDSQKVANGEEDYLIYVQVGDIQRLPMNFETWLDRFIVAQGARYWLW